MAEELYVVRALTPNEPTYQVLPDEPRAAYQQTYQEPTYHPEFAVIVTSDATVTLVASDKIRFRISANLLLSSSNYFADLPVDANGDRISDILKDSSEVIADILRMISGKQIPQSTMTSFSALHARLLVAEKWEMEGPRSILRVLILTNPEAKAYGMTVYSLGCYFKYEEMIAFGRRHSCNNDIYRDDLRSVVLSLDCKDLFHILQYHRERRTKLKNLLCGPGRTWFSCYRGGDHEMAQFKDFVWLLLEELDRIPPERPLSYEFLFNIALQGKMGDAICAHCTRSISVPGLIPIIQGFWLNL